MKNIAVRLEENNAEQLERVEIILRASGYKQQFEAWDVMMKGRGFNMVYAYSFGAFAVHNHLEPIDGFEVMDYQDFVNEYGKDEPNRIGPDAIYISAKTLEAAANQYANELGRGNMVVTEAVKSAFLNGARYGFALTGKQILEQ